jgi:Flp pilus assembly protein TadD
MYLADSSRNKAELISLAKMAKVYENKNDYETAIQVYSKILSIDPEKHDIRYRFVLAMIRAGQMENVIEHIDDLIAQKPDSGDYLNLKALILLHQNDAEHAWNYLKKAVSIVPDDEKTLLNLGTAKMIMGEYVSAEHYLRRASEFFEKNLTALLLLVENSVRSGNFQKAEKYADQLLSDFYTPQILNSLDLTNQTSLQWPISPELIAPVISERLKDQSSKLRELTKTDGT